jgi:hypothetical protein
LFSSTTTPGQTRANSSSFDGLAFGDANRYGISGARPPGRSVASSRESSRRQVEPESAEPDLITGHSIKTVSAADSEN